jgi:DNA modification methylase
MLNGTEMMEINKIYNENCLSLASRMPDNFIDCVITSPPYYGLRDYGTDGQFGLEETPEMFVENLVNLFREVRRAMKDTGTLWLNLGDSYAGSQTNNGGCSEKSTLSGGGGKYRTGSKNEKAYNNNNTKKIKHGIKPKDLIGIPWMVAFALRADGWYLRQDIIWHKPNPMPESVTDRCTKAHEYIFLLSKSQKYFYDADAIKEDSIHYGTDNRSDKGNIIYEGKRTENTDGSNGQDSFVTINEKRNKRSVWSVTTKPFKEAHFATFPEDLIEPCVLAGCPKGGLIYDPFGGAGTTAKVAVKHGRNYILSEINPDYIDIAEKRIRDFVILEGTPDPDKAIKGQQINLF